MSKHFYRAIITVIIISLLYFLFSCAISKDWMKPDGLLEQTIELIIEGETGMKIDLSPENSDNVEHILEKWSEDY